MTIQECASRDRRQVDNILFVLQANPLLQQCAPDLQVSIENSTVVLRGEVPSPEVKAQLIPAIRQAGVLDQISDYVRVASQGALTGAR